METTKEKEFEGLVAHWQEVEWTYVDVKEVITEAEKTGKNTTEKNIILRRLIKKQIEDLEYEVKEAEERLSEMQSFVTEVPVLLAPCENIPLGEEEWKEPYQKCPNNSTERLWCRFAKGLRCFASKCSEDDRNQMLCDQYHERE
jgi:hypothetical protein